MGSLFQPIKLNIIHYYIDNDNISLSIYYNNLSLYTIITFVFLFYCNQLHITPIQKV